MPASPTRAEAATDSAVASFGAAEGFADAIAMLDAVRPDGLIVATPGHTHVAIATAALERDIPVLLEKPVGLTAADAEALIAAEARSKAFVLPGHILRFSSPYRRTVAIAQSGELGRDPVGHRAQPPRRHPRACATRTSTRC